MILAFLLILTAAGLWLLLARVASFQLGEGFGGDQGQSGGQPAGVLVPAPPARPPVSRLPPPPMKKGPPAPIPSPLSLTLPPVAPKPPRTDPLGLPDTTRPELLGD
jgi:hypothetical protein